LAVMSKFILNFKALRRMAATPVFRAKTGGLVIFDLQNLRGLYTWSLNDS
jgi:hypothetical protein